MRVVSAYSFEQFEGGGSLSTPPNSFEGVSISPQGLDAPSALLSSQELRSEQAIRH